jgi:hypothetical protein
LNVGLKHMLDGNEQLLPQFDGTVFGKKHFLPNVHESCAGLHVVGVAFLVFHEGETAQRNIVQLWTHEQGVLYLTILTLLFIPLVYAKVCLITALMIPLEVRL